MKKILALLLAGCMALALCACGTPAEPADETGSGGDANASANGDTVVIGVFEPSPATTVPAVSRRFWVCSMQMQKPPQ